MSEDASTAVPAFTPVVDPLEEERRRFEQDLSYAQAQLRAKSPESWDAAVDLVKRAQALGPESLRKSVELQLAAAVVHARTDDAPEIAVAWMRSCGPDRADTCRRQAIAAVNRHGAKAKGAARFKKLVGALGEADRCLVGAEKKTKSGVVPPCLAEAERDYRRAEDDRMVARVKLARARTLAAKEETWAAAAREFEAVPKACSHLRCGDLQRRALQARAWLELRRNDPEAAATAALQDVALEAQSLPPAQRPWAWTDLAAKTCAVYERENGAGKCRTLEQRITGGHHFRDFSRAPARTEGLGPDTVREVNAHYGFTFEPCLQAQAARLVPPAEERYGVRWVVGNDGRVSQMHMDRNDRQHSPLAHCLREKLSLWRYPQYRGELQHVEQRFTVSARAALRAQ